MSELIRRQDALDALGEEPPVWTGSDYELGQRNQYDLDRLHLELVPSAQPKTGKWVKNYSVIRCSECKRSSWSLSFEDLVRNFNYCPNCGAMMKEGE